MKTTKSRSVTQLAPPQPPGQYASTPHLFVFQSNEEALRQPTEPVYQSAADISRLAAGRDVSSSRATCADQQEQEVQEQHDRHVQTLAVSDADIAQVESFFAGHKTQVTVCRALANMYLSSESNAWELKYTGIPAMVMDTGNTRSAAGGRQLQLVLAEKGTAFMLWRDRIDALSNYAAPDPSFHTMYLSSDRRQRAGFSFDDTEAARQFQTQLTAACADTAAGAAAAQDATKKRRGRRSRYVRPRKEDISQPCCFQHVTSVCLADMDRFYTLQSLVGTEEHS